MVYSAMVVQVMIASPGDVHEERNQVRDIIHEWNDIHSMNTGLVLLPVGWETHSSPDLGGRPQALINKQVLEKCDLLVGVFWTRLGTPTGEAESGSVEEIKKHVNAGKPAMVYFSTMPVAPQSFDQNQHEQLIDFKKWCMAQGLIQEYDNLSAFSEKFRRQIQITIRDNEYLKSIVDFDSNLSSENSNKGKGDDLVHLLRDQPIHQLSDEAKKLLVEASKDKNGRIISVRYLGGQSIQTNSINFADSRDRRSVARWEAALEQLLDQGLIVARGHKNEVFDLTSKGYEIADSLK